MSRQYRSILRDCQQQLDCNDDLSLIEDDPENRSLQSELLYKLELIWNLVEVLFVDRPSNGIILPQLLQWIELHFPQADDKTRQILSSAEASESPETHPDYWDAIVLFLMQGRRDQARNLLSLHSRSVLQGNSLNIAKLRLLIKSELKKSKFD